MRTCWPVLPQITGMNVSISYPAAVEVKSLQQAGEQSQFKYVAVGEKMN